jgi:hypothetical protein
MTSCILVGVTSILEDPAALPYRQKMGHKEAMHGHSVC